MGTFNQGILQVYTLVHALTDGDFNQEILQVCTLAHTLAYILVLILAHVLVHAGLRGLIFWVFDSLRTLKVHHCLSLVAIGYP